MLAVMALTTVCAFTAYQPTPHILSDTPSWQRLRPVLQDFFASDMDLPASRNTSAAPVCSGRGQPAAEVGGWCSCDNGYTGAKCEYAGPAWTIGPQPGLVPKSRAHHSLTAAAEPAEGDCRVACARRRRLLDIRAGPALLIERIHVDCRRVRAVAVDTAKDDETRAATPASDEGAGMAAAVGRPVANGVGRGPAARRWRVVVQVVHTVRLATHGSRSSEEIEPPVSDCRQAVMLC